MFRLADISENTPLYYYISAISSKTILNTLNDWVFSIRDVEEIYAGEFAGPPTGWNKTDFFEGLSKYIKERAPVTCDEFGNSYSEDGRAGMELIYRKISRMKEKMEDKNQFYTFDLFEEYLFYLMIKQYQVIEECVKEVPEGQQEEYMDEELHASIEASVKELINIYDIEEDYAEDMAEAAWRIEKMGPDDSSSYFWDTDFAFVFRNGFVDGIRGLVGGTAEMMGYGFDDVGGIFSDVGIKATFLVGSEAAFDTVGEVTKERMSEAMKDFSLKMPEIKTDSSGFRDSEEEDDDLPFA